MVRRVLEKVRGRMMQPPKKAPSEKGETPGEDPKPIYSVKRHEDGVREFRVLGPHPTITQVVFDLVRELPNPMGVVLVEYGESVRELVSSTLERQQVTESLFRLRDLLGSPLMDLAVFSEAHGIEIFLDQFGLLEVRTGSWLEPRVVAMLEQLEFETVPEVTPPVGVLEAQAPSAEQASRLQWVILHLGLRKPAEG